MDTSDTPRVIGSERFENGILVDFDDGFSSFYSTFLLQAIRDQAEPVIDEPDAREESPNS